MDWKIEIQINTQQFSVVNNFWMKKENLLIVVPIGQRPSSVFSISMGFIKNNSLV